MDADSARTHSTLRVWRQVDTKVIDRITNHERGQMINYLRITGLPLGLIFNFRYAKLQWQRLALSR
jgi:GxxExxY protein